LFKKLSSLLYIPVILINLSIISCSPGGDGIDLSLDSGTAREEEKILIRHGLNPHISGYILYDPETGKVIKSHNRKKTFIPASTTKILTALAALNVLGPDYRFKTELRYTGEIEKGILTGDIFLKGGGDPLLTVTDLMDLSGRLQANGIKGISGKFFYDDSELPRSKMINKKMESHGSYNPGLSALSLEFNSIFARWDLRNNSGKGGVFLVPSLPLNRSDVSSEEHEGTANFLFTEGDKIESWHLNPAARRKGIERLPVKNTALYTAEMFRKLSRLRGIQLPDPIEGKMPEKSAIIHIHSGRRLQNIAELTLTYSNNMMAELMLLQTARKISGNATDIEHSCEILSNYYRTKIRGINWDSLIIKNGSGLASGSRISPEQMLGVLAYADLQKYNGRGFMTLLPVSGWKGSLINRLNRPDRAFHVWAKTGTIDYAISLAGFILSASGKKFIFAVFVSDTDKRKRIDEIDVPSKEDSKNAAKWIEKNKKSIDNIISEWIEVL